MEIYIYKDSFCAGVESHGLGWAMPQLVKYLPCKHEGQSLILKTQVNKTSCGGRMLL